jgi:DNA-binding CsgD family transcriptional regulator
MHTDPVRRRYKANAAGRGPARGRPSPGAVLIDALSADLVQALVSVQFPAFAIDHQRRVRWQNAAATALVGDLRGKVDRSFLAPEDLARVREAFARKQMGALHTEYEATLVRADGARVRVAVSSVPLRLGDERMIGSFALVRALAEATPPAAPAARLTARQRQTLTLLAAGCSTSQMADLMGLSKETVRNHVKALLRRLDARSRVEALAKGRRANLI